MAAAAAVPAGLPAGRAGGVVALPAPPLLRLAAAAPPPAAHLLLHRPRDVERDVGGGAARAPRDVAEGGPERRHAHLALLQVGHPLVGLGREVLEAEEQLPRAYLGVQLVDDARHGCLRPADPTWGSGLGLPGWGGAGGSGSERLSWRWGGAGEVGRG